MDINGLGSVLFCLLLLLFAFPFSCVVSTHSQHSIFSYYPPTAITTLSILPTTLAVQKQLRDGSDRCIVRNVHSSAGPKLLLGCGTDGSSDGFCSRSQITGSASAAQQAVGSLHHSLSSCSRLRICNSPLPKQTSAPHCHQEA